MFESTAHEFTWQSSTPANEQLIRPIACTRDGESPEVYATGNAGEKERGGESKEKPISACNSSNAPSVVLRTPTFGQACSDNCNLLPRRGVLVARPTRIDQLCETQLALLSSSRPLVLSLPSPPGFCQFCLSPGRAACAPLSRLRHSADARPVNACAHGPPQRADAALKSACMGIGARAYIERAITYNDRSTARLN